jgi:DNA-binding SARP family transcriptional activator
MRPARVVQLHLSLLGGFRVRLASGLDVDVPRGKAQALLAYLGLQPGRRPLRDTLAGLLWGGTTDARARHNLRQALFTLRRSLPVSASILLREGDAVGLAAETVAVDVVTFERLAARATPEALTAAAALYEGQLLDGFTVDEAPFEEWLRTERERVHDLALEVFAMLLAHQMKEQAVEAAIRTAQRLLALDPLQEVAHRTLMRLFVQQGRRAAAVRQYRLCAEVIKRELGIEPEPATQALWREILR